MRPQGCRRRPEQHPGGEVEERQPLGHGEPAALLLAPGLAEVTLQLGPVGHREARAVDDPDPVAEPSRAARGGGPEGPGGGLQESVEDGQGEPLAGLAVAAVGEGPAAEVGHMAAGGVAVEDLEQEEVDGGGGVEDACPPAVVDLAARLLDRLPGQAGGEVLAQASEDGDDTRRHGRAPASDWSVVINPQVARSSSRAQEVTRRFLVKGYALTSWHSRLVDIVLETKLRGKPPFRGLLC